MWGQPPSAVRRPKGNWFFGGTAAMKAVPLVLRSLSSQHWTVHRANRPLARPDSRRRLSPQILKLFRGGVYFCSCTSPIPTILDEVRNFL